MLYPASGIEKEKQIKDKNLNKAWTLVKIYLVNNVSVLTNVSLVDNVSIL